MGEGEREEEGRLCIIVYLVSVFVRTLFIVVGHVVFYHIVSYRSFLALVVCQSPIPSPIYAHAHILPATFTIFLIHSLTHLPTHSASSA